MECTISDLINLLSEYPLDSKLIITGEIKIIEVKTILSNLSIEEDKGSNNDIDDKHNSNKSTTKVTPSFILPKNIQDILHWDLSEYVSRSKVSNFINTLLTVWNPNNSIDTLNLKSLNNTTLSRALYSCRDKEDPNARETVNELVKNLIIINLDYLKLAYMNKTILEYL